jgi:recombinational DNA repair protein (RecF pathway)
MHVEGIIIHKTPVKARDLVAKILLRDGKILSVYFYGGQGGGKHQKGTVLELGHMLKITLSPRKKHLDTELAVAKEWKLQWDSELIRTDVMAFYYMCFIFEVILKIAVQEHLDELEHENPEYEGLFNVVSNALFYADKGIAEKQFELIDHLFIFIAKLILQLGIVPSMGNCSYCGISLEKVAAIFEPHQGGMACEDCLRQRGQSMLENKLLDEELKSSTRLKHQMQHVLEIPYKEFATIRGSEKGMVHAMFNHFCYQFHFNPNDFKTKSMLF